MSEKYVDISITEDIIEQTYHENPDKYRKDIIITAIEKIVNEKE